ncbi:hypothetical protein A5740_11270 [Mycobacterium sp. GA-1841]|uniref:hypothetical protein n=1 Tax=Mycobacterium sp. GA-1841 TaxID=1834154 RepID=UPI00096C1FF1|nr:hypothetical protein [Mycobacterium sp. GA-1841]OMC33864.1 hypothetical protein A5740_11270 [Mycobacterium sp. GA-1841]
MVLDGMSDSKQSATALAVEVLDELRVSILECLLALHAIDQEATIDFGTLTETLAVSSQVARQTFIAASLLHQGAELTAACCDDSCTTPGSIINRHRAAVAEGAVAVAPDRSDVDEFETEIGGLFFGGAPLTGGAPGIHPSAAAAVDKSATHNDQESRLDSGGTEISIEENPDGYRNKIEKVLISRRQRHMATHRDAIRAAGSHVVQQWMVRRASAMAENE